MPSMAVVGVPPILSVVGVRFEAATFTVLTLPSTVDTETNTPELELLSLAEPISETVNFVGAATTTFVTLPFSVETVTVVSPDVLVDKPFPMSATENLAGAVIETAFT